MVAAPDFELSGVTQFGASVSLGYREDAKSSYSREDFSALAMCGLVLRSAIVLSTRWSLLFESISDSVLYFRWCGHCASVATEIVRNSLKFQSMGHVRLKSHVQPFDCTGIHTAVQFSRWRQDFSYGLWSFFPGKSYMQHPVGEGTARPVTCDNVKSQGHPVHMCKSSAETPDERTKCASPRCRGKNSKFHQRTTRRPKLQWQRQSSTHCDKCC